eukprot:209692-Pyramimonas_sp.AAC.1
MTEKCRHASAPIGVVRWWIWARDIRRRRRPASAREVDAAPAHARCGFAHLPVHPLLLTNQTLSSTQRGGQGKQADLHVDAAMRTAMSPVKPGRAVGPSECFEALPVG